MLKNWFINVGESKVAIITKALTIYLENLGRYDSRTAYAYLQLGRTRVNWHLDWNLATADLKQALHIMDFLHGDDDSAVHRVKRGLAEQYMYAEDFDTVHHYLWQVINPDDPNFSCADKNCLWALLMMTKAYLYKGDRAMAQRLVPLFAKSVNDNKLKLSFSTEQEIKTVQMRVAGADENSLLTLSQIRARISGVHVNAVAARNGFASKSVIIELYNQQLHSYPKSVDIGRYITALKDISLDNYTPFMTNGDKRFLFTRAMEDCSRHSAAFCARLSSEVIRHELHEIKPVISQGAVASVKTALKEPLYTTGADNRATLSP